LTTKEIKIWRIDTGQEVFSVPESSDFSPDGHRDLIWSLDAKRLASVGCSSIHIYEVASRRRLCRLTTLTGRRTIHFRRLPRGIGWSPDGQRFAASDTMEYEAAVIYAADTGRELKRISGHPGDFLVLRWSPDGRIIVTGGENGEVNGWDAE